MSAPEGGAVFDGVPVVVRGDPAEGFQVRDVAAGGDYVWLEKGAIGLALGFHTSGPHGPSHP